MGQSCIRRNLKMRKLSFEQLLGWIWLWSVKIPISLVRNSQLYTLNVVANTHELGDLPFLCCWLIPFLACAEINFNGSLLQYEVLDVLEFTSDRKKMSVVVKDCQNGKFLLLSKGADEAILPCASAGILFSQLVLNALIKCITIWICEMDSCGCNYKLIC